MVAEKVNHAYKLFIQIYAFCIIHTYRGDQTDNLIMSSIYKTVRGLNTNIRKPNHLHAKARYMYSGGGNRHAGSLPTKPLNKK